MISKLQICSENYKRWKKIALSSGNLEEVKKAMRRAFFWLEMHSAFLALDAAENKKMDKESLFMLLRAKAKICKKLADYAEEILKEFE